MLIKVLLLIAAYLYRANHPAETQVQVMAGVIADLKMVKVALNKTDKKDIE